MESSSVEKFEDCPLLLLPSLVMEKIIAFLDIVTLKRLRRVCTATKDIVDNPSLLKKFRITIRDRERLRSVLKSDQMWTNFTFIITEKFPTDDDVLKWNEEFGGSTKSLILTHVQDVDLLETQLPKRFCHVANLFIERCNSLEYFETEGLDFTKIEKNTWSKILENWKGLKQLKLRKILFIITEATGRYFTDIVENCPNLETLQLPRFLPCYESPSTIPFSRHRESVEIYSQEAFVKAFEYSILYPALLKTYTEFCASGTSNLKALYVPEELIPLAVYRTVAELCSKVSVTLHYYDPQTYPSQYLDFPKEDEEALKFSTCIGSLAGANESVFHRHFDNLEHLSINRANFRFTSDGPYEIPSFPKLESLALHLDTWSSIDMDKVNVRRLSSFMTCLKESHCPCLRSIYMSKFQYVSTKPCPYANLVRPYLLQAFGNLTKLYLQAVAFLPEEYIRLWSTLRKLESVTLKSCEGVNDDAIIGKNPEVSLSPLLSLSDLKYLRLMDVQVTSRSYEFGFSKIKLIELYHVPSNWVDQTIYGFLVDGPVWDYLEIFMFDETGFTNFQEKVEFLHAFRKRVCQSQVIYSVEMTGHIPSYSSNKLIKNKKGCICT